MGGQLQLGSKSNPIQHSWRGGGSKMKNMLVVVMMLAVHETSCVASSESSRKDLVPPWPQSQSQSQSQSSQQQQNPSPPRNDGTGNVDSAIYSSRSSPPPPSPMRFTALHVTMIFIAILLCVIICAIPWDNFKCRGNRHGQNRSQTHIQNQNQQQDSASNAASSPTDEEEGRQAGVSKKMIKSFKLVRYGCSSLRAKAEEIGGDDGSCWSECMICLCDFRNGQMVRILPHCGHGFHKKCIDQWLTSHTSCPICRDALLVLDSPDKSIHRQNQDQDQNNAIQQNRNQQIPQQEHQHEIHHPELLLQEHDHQQQLQQNQNHRRPPLHQHNEDQIFHHSQQEQPHHEIRSRLHSQEDEELADILVDDVAEADHHHGHHLDYHEHLENVYRTYVVISD